MGQVIQIDEARIRAHLGEVVRGTVEEAFNAMLDTKAVPVSLRIPKLRRQTFETAIIERYQRREISLGEALIEMYIAGV
jgi:transposase-like protein